MHAAPVWRPEGALSIELPADIPEILKPPILLENRRCRGRLVVRSFAAIRKVPCSRRTCRHQEIPLGERARIRLDNGDAVVSAEIGGIVVDLRVNGSGVQVDGNRVAQELERLRDRNNETLQRARDEQRKAGEMARQAMKRARERIEAASERYEAEMRRSAQQ